MPIAAFLEQLGQDVGDRRGAARLRLTLGSALGRCGSPVTIRNLSTTGLQLETSAVLADGDVIELHLPEAGRTSATIVWSDGNAFGCRFDHPIPKGAVSAALLRGDAAPVPAPVAAEPEGDASEPSRWLPRIVAAVALAAVAGLLVVAPLPTAGVLLLLAALLVAWGFSVLNDTFDLKP